MKPLIPKFPNLIHGADYNPEQWLRYPEVLKKDIALLKEAHMNSVSVGIFSWAHLERREGVYDFDWLEKIINNLYDNGIYTVLATPSGAKPLWMSEKYEEVRRVNKAGVRDMSGVRHNHCYTSPYYREKVCQMNTKLAEKFSSHPGVVLWHLSNEYGGECYCPLCQEEFRKWLKNKYKTLDELNHAWWTDFWSHTYGDWSQVRAPMIGGEMSVHGLNLDWKRFVTDRTVDFCRAEAEAVRKVNPEIPVTANLMGFYEQLDYYKFKSVLDIVSWDNYPWWHHGDNVQIAQYSACSHDLMRGIMRQNFLLMENTPSCVNWTPVSKLKRDGVHYLSAMQALAHGSNSIQYFQFRKSRGSFEKMHGAVVDHVGHSDTRVFKEITRVGKKMEELTERLYNTEVKAEVAVIYDWENRWALEDSAGPRRGKSLTEDGGASESGMHYVKTVNKHHRALWNLGVNVDVLDMDADFGGYKIVAAPLLYMFRAGIEKKLREFVEKGGTLIATYHTGIVNDTDLCYLGGWPGEMMDVFGIWNEDIDGLWDEDKTSFTMSGAAPFKGTFAASELCALIHANEAKVLATYDEDLYEGWPALTVNAFKGGKAYYLAANAEQEMLNQLYETLVKDAGVARSLDAKLPHGVSAHRRSGETDFIFLENYIGEEKEVVFNREYEDAATGERLKSIKLGPWEVVVLTDITKN